MSSNKCLALSRSSGSASEGAVMMRMVVVVVTAPLPQATRSTPQSASP